jgi:hypothetical protein
MDGPGNAIVTASYGALLAILGERATRALRNGFIRVINGQTDLNLPQQIADEIDERLAGLSESGFQNAQNLITNMYYDLSESRDTPSLRGSYEDGGDPPGEGKSFLNLHNGRQATFGLRRGSRAGPVWCVDSFSKTPSFSCTHGSVSRPVTGSWPAYT